MQWFVRGLRSSVGAKFIMALTGLMLFGFVLAHMLGNLQLFAGREQINGYAADIKALGPLLWVARLGLLGVFLLHIATALALTLGARQARPVPYANQRPIKSTYASRTMIWSGVALVLFVVYHLAHTTFGWLRPEHYALQETLVDGSTRHDVYSMMVLGFREPAIALTYIVAMIGLGMHLMHGVNSAFQSLGLIGPRWRGLIHRTCLGIVAVIVLGNLSMPLAGWAGALPLPEDVAALPEVADGGR